MALARTSSASCAFCRLAGSPCHVRSTLFCRARAYENDTCHGFGVWFIALRLSVASSSDWPPERNMMPGTAGGTRRRRSLRV